LEHIDISAIIKGVIVGDRTPKVYYPLINYLCKNLKIESRVIYWDDGIPLILMCN
jgi:hypothetical protein